MRPHEATRGYRRSGGYRRLQEATGGYRRQQEATGHYRAKAGYRRPQ